MLGNRPKRRATTVEDTEKLEAEVRKIVGHRGYMGPSLLEMLWEELDSLVKGIIEANLPEAEKTNCKAQALGVAYCIAVIQNPYSARLAREDAIEAVRRQSMERYHHGT